MWLTLVFMLAVDTLPAPAALDSVPSVSWFEADALEDAWRAVRRLQPPSERAKAFVEQRFERSVCRGVVDMRALDPEHGFSWQNDIALREWARPALARVLVVAHAAFRARFPAQRIGVGDVAQAGCGHIDPGALTRWIVGAEAQALLARAQVVAGTPTLIERTSDMLIESRVVGRDGAALFVHVRRYRATRDGTTGLDAKVRAIITGGVLIADAAGDDVSGNRRQHWVDPQHHRQVIVVGVRPYQLATASDVSVAPWAPARPGEMRGERRWRREGDLWQAWQLLEEGAHATHMAGLDADLSYPMQAPERRFATDPAAIDVAATWAWFELLVATGDALGTPVDRIVVGARVLPRLLREVPGASSSRVAKLLKVVTNHDDHHHLRLSRPSPAADASARASLGLGPEIVVEVPRDPALDERAR